MNATELRELNSQELEQRARDMEDQLFKLRMQKAMGQLEAAHKVASVRRDLARVKTVLREKENG
jgi:large subunit ribosomal protein L29